MAKGEVKFSFPSLAASLCLPGSRAECTAPPPSRLLRESGRKTEGGSTSHAYLEGDDDDDASMAPLNLWTAISPDGEGDGGEGAAATVMGGIGGSGRCPRVGTRKQGSRPHGTARLLHVAWARRMRGRNPVVVGQKKTNNGPIFRLSYRFRPSLVHS